MSKREACNFFRRPEKGEDFAVCKICARSVKNKGGNTSNLLQHIRRSHPSHICDDDSVGTKVHTERYSSIKHASDAGYSKQPLCQQHAISTWQQAPREYHRCHHLLPLQRQCPVERSESTRFSKTAERIRATLQNPKQDNLFEKQSCEAVCYQRSSYARFKQHQLLCLYN